MAETLNGKLTAVADKITKCASYKEAKHLAAARRRSHEDNAAYAVFAAGVECWCVKSAS